MKNGLANFSTLTGLMLLTAGFISMSAVADDDSGGFYLGAGAGSADYFAKNGVCETALDEAKDELEDEFGSSAALDALFKDLVDNADCDDDVSDSTKKAFVGFRFNDAFALEAGYIDLGEFDADISADYSSVLGSVNANANARADITGFFASALLSAPLGPVGIFGKIGVLSWEGDADGEIDVTVTDFSGNSISRQRDLSFDDSGTDLNYGAGLRLKLGNRAALRAEWERFETVDIDMISASIELYLN